MIAGANRDDHHLRHVTPGEDFQAVEHDVRQVLPGDACIRCGAALEERMAMEVARFDGPRAMPDLHITNAAAEEVPLSMSACSVAIDRILPAIALARHDADGLILPRALAPFDVIVTPANYSDPAQRQATHAIYTECGALGLDALLDDRDERPGVKFKDADLIGIPYRITVGKKLAGGLVEVVERKTKQERDTAAAHAATAVRDAIAADVV
jgi:prolyl-tRNA synthetase